jgi:hypothetical protein
MVAENIQRYVHLPLPRAEAELERRIRPGISLVSPKPFIKHGSQLNTQIGSVLQRFQSRKPIRPLGIDPKLLLRIRLERAGIVSDDEWRKNGLTLVSEDRDGTTVLLASEFELKEFRRRLREYQKGPKPQRKRAPHSSLFDGITEVREYGPEDRKGRLLQGTSLDPQKKVALDLELWHPGDDNKAREMLAQVERYISQQGGKIVDRYVSSSVCLARVIVRGFMIDKILQLEPVARIDLPPRPALTVGEVAELTIKDFQPIPKPPQDAQRICVIDSGIASGHPLISPAIGDSISAPSSLGSPIDEYGHGTMVSGLALYSDISECIKNRKFNPSLWVMSAKVTEIENTSFGPKMKFPDEKLISTQMRDAIEYFHKEHGCRVFNISLGDDQLVYEGGKPSIWAWTLDDIARKLDVVIVVSAGNSQPMQLNSVPEDVLTDYPKYLLGPENRIIEPATAAIALTVGSLAHSEAPRGPGGRDDVALKAVSPVNAPSPFTRTGPGIGDAIKPELCEYGGNLVFDHRLKNLQRRNVDVEIISFCHDYAKGRLFAWDSGTSFSAPKVAHYATQLLNLFPQASANLIRAFLASSALIPASSKDILRVLGNDACTKVCGYGKPNFDMASYSFDDRVTLYAENELVGDHVHVYEVPLPDVFRKTRGIRSISATLAFDPPTRHTRKDYLGFTMKFWLVRGKKLDQVLNIFQKIKPGEEKIEGISGTSFECDLEPGHRVRERGTLQKGIFIMSKNPDEKYSDTYYLVVQCARNWTDEEKQRYTIAVVLEHMGMKATLFERVSLYQAVQERIEARERIRLRR